MDLSLRDHQLEMMDEATISSCDLKGALKGLSRLNRLSLTSTIIANKIRELLKNTNAKASVSILDTGCGDGSNLKSIVSALTKDGYTVSAIGCDVNKTTIQYAKENVQGSSEIKFVTCRADAAIQTIPHDIVISSHFLHHLTNSEVASLLSASATHSAIGLVMTDLERRKINYWMTFLASRIVTRSPIVHYDGPTSVRAAFTREELQQYSSSLPGMKVVRTYPCHLLISWTRIR